MTNRSDVDIVISYTVKEMGNFLTRVLKHSGLDSRDQWRCQDFSSGGASVNTFLNNIAQCKQIWLKQKNMKKNMGGAMAPPGTPPPWHTPPPKTATVRV